MNKPKTKAEALAQLEELKAYIDAMPDECTVSNVYDMELDLTANKEGTFSFSINSDGGKDVFLSEYNYLEKTTRFRMMAHYFAQGFKPDWSNVNQLKCYVCYNNKANQWQIFSAWSIQATCIVHLPEEQAQKFADWCNKEYPNGINQQGD